MTTDPTALSKIGEWTFICGDEPEILVKELANLGFAVVRRVEGATGSCVSEPAKAKARVVYEPFGLDAYDELAPLDYSLAEAEHVKADLEWQRARVAGRDR